MINENSFLAAADLALLLHDSNKVIRTKPNTPLNEICRFSTADGSTVFNKDTVFTTEDNRKEICKTLESLTDITAHNERYELFVKQIADSITTSVAYTRNTIVAAIDRTSTKVMDWLQKLDTDPVSKFQIIQDKLPEPLVSDGFLDKLERDNGNIFVPPERFFNLDSAGPSWIIDFLLTGSAGFDNKIRAWVATKGDAFLVNTWEKYFTNKTEFRDANQEFLLDIETNIDMALFVYLAACKLHDDPPEGMTMSLSDFNATVIQYRETAARSLLRTNAKYRENKSSKMLVTLNKRAEKKVYVHPDVYLEWIKEGNTNEMLFGALIGQSSYYYAKDFTEHKDELLRTWATYCQVSRAKFKNDHFAAFLNILQSVVVSDIQNKSSEEESFFTENPNAFDNILKLLEEELKTVVFEDMTDIHRVVTRLVCKSRYFYTNAYTFLQAMDEAMKMDKNTTPEEASLIATIETLSDFMAEQMVVTDIAV